MLYRFDDGNRVAAILIPTRPPAAVIAFRPLGHGMSGPVRSVPPVQMGSHDPRQVVEHGTDGPVHGPAYVPRRRKVPNRARRQSRQIDFKVEDATVEEFNRHIEQAKRTRPEVKYQTPATNNLSHDHSDVRVGDRTLEGQDDRKSKQIDLPEAKIFLDDGGPDLLDVEVLKTLEEIPPPDIKPPPEPMLPSSSPPAMPDLDKFDPICTPVSSWLTQ